MCDCGGGRARVRRHGRGSATRRRKAIRHASAGGELVGPLLPEGTPLVEHAALPALQVRVPPPRFGPRRRARTYRLERLTRWLCGRRIRAWRSLGRGLRLPCLVCLCSPLSVPLPWRSVPRWACATKQTNASNPLPAFSAPPPFFPGHPPPAAEARLTRCPVAVCAWACLWVQFNLGDFRSNAEELIAKVDVIEVDGDVAVCNGGQCLHGVGPRPSLALTTAP